MHRPCSPVWWLVSLVFCSTNVVGQYSKADKCAACTIRDVVDDMENDVEGQGDGTGLGDVEVSPLVSGDDSSKPAKPTKGSFKYNELKKQYDYVGNDRQLDPKSGKWITPEIGPQDIERGTEQWSYENAASWGSLRAEWDQCASGQAQSPVDIDTNTSKRDCWLEPVKFSYSCAPAELVKDDHKVAIKVGLPEDSTEEVSLDLGAGYVKFNQATYFLHDAEIHIPSEHTIDGKPAAMELQLHHLSESDDLFVVVLFDSYDGAPCLCSEMAGCKVIPSTNSSNSTVPDNLHSALNKLRSTGCVPGLSTGAPKTKDQQKLRPNSVTCVQKLPNTSLAEVDEEAESGREEEMVASVLSAAADQQNDEGTTKTTDNPWLAPLVDLLALFATPDSSTQFHKIGSFEFSNLLPMGMGETPPFYFYWGSTSTPPCREGIPYLVMEHRQLISQRQIDILQDALPVENVKNRRPTQPLKGRLVKKYPSQSYKNKVCRAEFTKQRLCNAGSEGRQGEAHLSNKAIEALIGQPISVFCGFVGNSSNSTNATNATHRAVQYKLDNQNAQLLKAVVAGAPTVEEDAGGGGGDGKSSRLPLLDPFQGPPPPRPIPVNIFTERMVLDAQDQELDELAVRKDILGYLRSLSGGEGVTLADVQVASFNDVNMTICESPGVKCVVKTQDSQHGVGGNPNQGAMSTSATAFKSCRHATFVDRKLPHRMASGSFCADRLTDPTLSIADLANCAVWGRSVAPNAEGDFKGLTEMCPYLGPQPTQRMALKELVFTVAVKGGDSQLPNQLEAAVSAAIGDPMSAIYSGNSIHALNPLIKTVTNSMQQDDAEPPPMRLAQTRLNPSPSPKAAPRTTVIEFAPVKTPPRRRTKQWITPFGNDGFTMDGQPCNTPGCMGLVRESDLEYAEDQLQEDAPSIQTSWGWVGGFQG